MKSSELFKLLTRNGWFVIRQSGSHVIMGHPSKETKITVPFHQSKEVAKGLLKEILKQAGIKTAKR